MSRSGGSTPWAKCRTAKHRIARSWEAVREPALVTSMLAPSIFRARPSAIWLRAEFATHRNKMRFIQLSSSHSRKGLTGPLHRRAAFVPALAGVHDFYDREHD